MKVIDEIYRLNLAHSMAKKNSDIRFDSKPSLGNWRSETRTRAFASELRYLRVSVRNIVGVAYPVPDEELHFLKFSVRLPVRPSLPSRCCRDASYASVITRQSAYPYSVGGSVGRYNRLYLQEIRYCPLSGPSP